MGIFNYVKDIGGGDMPFVAKIRLSENVDVEKGDILYYNDQTKTVTPNKGNLYLVAGVCAATYKAQKSDLVPYYGCGMVDVIVADGALYRTPVCFITSDGDYNNTVVTTFDDMEEKKFDDYVGAKLILAEKAENSTNPHLIGTCFEIKDFVGCESKIGLYVGENVSGSKGDKYIFVPNYGFNQLKVDSTGNLNIYFNDTKGRITVVAADENGYTVRITTEQ